MLSFEQLHGTELEPSAAVDAECIALIETLRQGFPPDRNAVPDQIKCRCVNHCTKLTAYRSAATKCLRAEVTEALHGAHQGVNGMLNNARERLFWPGLDAQIRLRKAQCRVCNEISPSQAREPMMDHVNQLEMPFQQTVTDLFEKSGHHYLVYADRYSGWVEITHITTTDAKRVTNCLRRWFCTYRVPEEIRRGSTVQQRRLRAVHR